MIIVVASGKGGTGKTTNDREDVRAWTLMIERGMIFKPKDTESPTTKPESPTTKNDLFKEGENQE